MRVHPRMEIRRNNGTVHLEAKGVLDGNLVWDLINVALRECDGESMVVVNVEKVEDITSFGAQALKNLLAHCGYLKDKVVLQGLAGEEEVARVTMSACGEGGTCKCDGRCTHCACKAGAVHAAQL